MLEAGELELVMSNETCLGPASFLVLWCPSIACGGWRDTVLWSGSSAVLLRGGVEITLWDLGHSSHLKRLTGVSICYLRIPLWEKGGEVVYLMTVETKDPSSRYVPVPCRWLRKSWGKQCCMFPPWELPGVLGTFREALQGLRCLLCCILPSWSCCLPCFC